jgi:undecaprenyl-diphosphatase
MNFFDAAVMNFINGFSRQSLLFDKFMVAVVDLDLLKGGILVGLIWAFWFGSMNEAQKQSVRERMLSALVGCFAALVTARVLALTLPFRYRPVHDPLLDFVVPYEMPVFWLEDWSSFPSDHAILFLTLAFSFWFASRRLGLYSLIYTFVMILFPRVYVGLHYPTDILAGIPVGFAFAWLFNLYAVRKAIAKPFLHVANMAPGFFYFCFFILSYQITTLFDDVRDISEKAFKLIFKYLLNLIS